VTHSSSAERPEPRLRILVASYHFPPDAAVGGLRIAKFVRFLPEFGWVPHVLTVEDQLREEGIDNSRLTGLEHVPTVRTRELPRVMESVSRIKSALRRRGRADGAASSSGTETWAPPSGRETLTRRLKRHFVSLFALLPDEKKNWSLYAAWVGVRLIRRHKIDWVLTSGPPFSVHVIGLIAKVFTRAKWIADFRDPWIDMLPDRFPHTRSHLSDLIERWMESAVAKSANRVVTTTERMRDAMAARYSSLPAEKFVCVANSIDANQFQVVDRYQKYEALTITYTGNLYFERTPEPLFRAAGELIRSGRASTADIRIKLVGHCRYIEGVETRVVADRYGLGEVVEVIDRVPYPEAVRIMRQSHLLLVLAPERHRLVVPAKIYDYMGSGSKILTLAEPGATSDLMDETQCGQCFSQSDVKGLSEYLFRLLRDGSYRELRNQPELFSRYDARVLTGRLAAEMTDADARLRDEVMVRT
jgi:glycosyl transferase family 4